MTDKLRIKNSVDYCDENVDADRLIVCSDNVYIADQNKQGSVASPLSSGNILSLWQEKGILYYPYGDSVKEEGEEGKDVGQRTDNFSIYYTATTSSPTLYKTQEKILEGIECLKRLHNDQVEMDAAHVEKTNANHSEILDKLTSLEKENAALRKELNMIYSPQCLEKWSIYISIICILMLFFGALTEVSLIHPYLVLLIVISAVFFYVMSIVMKNKHE